MNLRTVSDALLGEVDAKPLARYRVALGALLCCEAVQRLPYAAELFSSEGFHRTRFAVPVPSAAGAYALVAASALGAAAMSLGWRTRLSTLVTLLSLSWLYAIDQVSEKALHSLSLVMLAALAISDAGAVYSLDARRLGARARAWVTPLRLLQLELAQVYFFAGVVKLRAPGWIEGEVLSRTMSSRWADAAGMWAARAMPHGTWRALSVATIVFELAGPWLLFVPRVRRYAIAAGVMFHLGIEATLGVGWLGLHFIAALVTLFPSPEAWERGEAWVRQRLRGAGSAA